MNEELKPCPFCGGEAIIVLEEAKDKNNNNIDLIVKCGSCLAETWGDFIEEPDYEIVGKIKQAIETWNQRV